MQQAKDLQSSELAGGQLEEKAASKKGRNLKAELLADAERLAAPPAVVSHEQLFADLLEQVQPVNFRELARLDDEKDKLHTSHYVVLVIEQVLQLAQQNSWGLCRRQGFLYAYNGAYWKQIEEPTLRTFLRQVAERQGVPAMKARHHGFSEQLYKQFLELASLPAPAATTRAAVLVNLQNGTFEIGQTQQLRPTDPADFLTHQLPFAYEPGATAPRWQTFLNRVVPNPASQQVLAEYLGYVFIAPARLKLEKVLLLYGTGANGKSVFFEVVTALLGPENVSSYSLKALTSEPAYCRAHLATKLVNYASELHGKLEADAFKQLASGEPVEARLPYGQPFILTDYAKLIFNCNELPTEVEQTHAFFRRFLIIPFNVTIPEAEQDKTLAGGIIREELAGVFNWILAGLGRVLSQQGFTDCEAARQQLELYRLQSDTVRLFLDEFEYTASPEVYEATDGVYRGYRQFCADFGSHPVGRQKFVGRLKAAGIAQTRIKTGMVLHLSRPL
ncbi:DNA primase family protein [Hymenobacter rubripertinctus]|uniref:DNA primase n=1 Tax=Hymenobacter rubripertinctus TaxID=2029981 RepID=A0A418R4I2_9BACT|nr:phage/plasmid primase, P4 family [Hymenobacter rubripertinctus]RIY12357.1 DNA primase [Hymenobacter rubripertinctus]